MILLVVKIFNAIETKMSNRHITDSFRRQSGPSNKEKHSGKRYHESPSSHKYSSYSGNGERDK